VHTGRGCRAFYGVIGAVASLKSDRPGWQRGGSGREAGERGQAGRRMGGHASSQVVEVSLWPGNAKLSCQLAGQAEVQSQVVGWLLLHVPVPPQWVLLRCPRHPPFSSAAPTPIPTLCWRSPSTTASFLPRTPSQLVMPSGALPSGVNRAAPAGEPPIHRATLPGGWLVTFGIHSASEAFHDCGAIWTHETHSATAIWTHVTGFDPAQGSLQMAGYKHSGIRHAEPRGIPIVPSMPSMAAWQPAPASPPACLPTGIHVQASLHSAAHQHPRRLVCAHQLSSSRESQSPHAGRARG